jgi:hypothetical protein
MAKPVYGSAAKGRTSGEACGILIRAPALLSVLLGSSGPLNSLNNEDCAQYTTWEGETTWQIDGWAWWNQIDDHLAATS